MGAWVQGATHIDEAAPAASIAKAFAANVTAGNLIYVWAGFDGSQLPTVADTVGNTYTLIRNTFDAGNNQSHASYQASNILGGANTVTVSFSPNAQYKRLGIAEISGLTISNPVDQETGQVQASPGTAVDGVSSGNMLETVNANCFIVASTQNIAEANPSSGTLAAGTNYTLREITGTNIGTMESRQIVAGIYAGTFTRSVDLKSITHVVAFKDLEELGFWFCQMQIGYD